MMILGLTLVVVGLWTTYEIYRAPLMDEKTGRIIKPGRKLSDLWKKKN